MLRKKRLLLMVLLLAFSLAVSIRMVHIIFSDDYKELNWEGDGKYEEGIEIQTQSQAQLKRELEDVENENSKRLERIEAVCRKYNLGFYRTSKTPSIIKHPPTPQYSVFYFDRTHKWSLCPIYKAGSSTWLHNLLILGGMTEAEIATSQKQLSEMARALYPELDPSAAEEELSISTKVLTVRHPFERILSAYRDKLENTNWGGEHGTLHYYKAYGSKIVKKYRPGGNNTKTNDILKSGEYMWNPDQPNPAGFEPTFQEFARYLIDTDIVAKSDDHWIPYYLFCTPCLLRYDFIGKIETFQRDQTYIIRSLGLQDQIKAKWSHKTQFTETAPYNAVSPAAQAYFHQLTSAQIFQLYEKYRIDFELFNYDFKPYLKFSRDSSSNFTKD